MANVLYPRPRKHTYNTACYFIDKVFGDKITVKHVGEKCGWYRAMFYLDNNLVGFYDEESGDLWTTVQ